MITNNDSKSGFRERFREDDRDFCGTTSEAQPGLDIISGAALEVCGETLF